MDPAPLKHRLFASALAPEARAELELASAAWFGEAGPPPDGTGQADFLDFFCLEWVDAEGFTLLERHSGDALDPEHRRWLMGVRTGVFVVDEYDADFGYASLRDVLTDEELALATPQPLAPRSVLRARLLPDDKGAYALSGEPELHEPLGVIARIDLARNWGESRRKAVVDHMRSLREGFVLQREQRAAFVAFFQADELVCSSADALELHLNAFIDHLLNRYLPPGLGGQTYADHHRATRGEDPVTVRLELGQTLSGPGRPGVIFDAREGVHLLPAYGDFREHLLGKGQHPEVVQAYLDDPGISSLPFRRVGVSAALSAYLGREDPGLEALLAELKPAPDRLAPSHLPGFDA